jgi:hypothetical protein
VVAVGEGDGASGCGRAGLQLRRGHHAFGWSVGKSSTVQQFGSDAVLWSPSGKATVLQDAGGAGISEAFDINDLGWSVGESDTPGFNSEAVLWSPSGKATDLAAVLGPAWSDTEAQFINDLGDIAGIGIFNGGLDAILLTPNGANSWALASISAASVSDPAVPEPSTWVMMLSASQGLAGWRACAGATSRRREPMAFQIVAMICVAGTQPQDCAPEPGSSRDGAIIGEVPNEIMCNVQAQWSLGGG